jgi:hypothetical protein
MQVKTSHKQSEFYTDLIQNNNNMSYFRQNI